MKPTWAGEGSCCREKDRDDFPDSKFLKSIPARSVVWKINNFASVMALLKVESVPIYPIADASIAQPTTQ